MCRRRIPFKSKNAELELLPLQKGMKRFPQRRCDRFGSADAVRKQWTVGKSGIGGNANC